MTIRPELAFNYDRDMRPVSAQCSLCGEKMPPLPPDVRLPGDVIVWLSRRFLDHKKLKHTGGGKSGADISMS
jgi:hypothetical protein